jgi:hypothetical protein
MAYIMLKGSKAMDDMVYFRKVSLIFINAKASITKIKEILLLLLFTLVDGSNLLQNFRMNWVQSHHQLSMDPRYDCIAAFASDN